jgi:hypothetical protein
MDALFAAIGENLLYVIIGVCFLVGMLLKALVQLMSTSARERSRREIAAYIAEGSITPDQGERILRAEVDGKGHKGA